MIPAHRSRVSAWWLLGPGLLFGFSFLAAVLTTTTPDKNLVYNLQAIVVTAVVDVVLAGTWCSRCGCPRRRSPTRWRCGARRCGGGRLGALALVVLIVLDKLVDPITHAEQEAGHRPRPHPG